MSNKPDATNTDFSVLLSHAKSGDAESARRLFAVLSADLRATAVRLMQNERSNHTLQATALVNEACLRLLDQQMIRKSRDKRYLYASATQAMRQILVDHSRKRNSAKRGGDMKKTPLDAVLEHLESKSGFLFEDLDTALTQLGEDSPRQREVVECRFFNGLSVAETAELLEVSEGTIERDWRLARLKLYAVLKDKEHLTEDC